MRFYTGTYTNIGGPGISVCHWDDEKIIKICSVSELNDPIYLILSDDGKTLFAVGCDEEVKGVAASYHAGDDELCLISSQETGGCDSCHLALSEDERFLYVANYQNGSISVFPVKDGRLDKCIQFLEHKGSGPNKTRQEAAHTHQCVFRPGTHELFVCDLGMDCIVIYDQDPKGGMLCKKDEIVLPPGMGPRHLVFADKGRFYVTGELDNFVRCCIYTEGSWKIVDEISSLPEGYQGESYTAAIRLYEGKLYVSNRGHDSLCTIRLDEQGRMFDAVCTPTGGLYPRDFVVTPRGIIIANQNGGGIITDAGVSLPMAGAVCICIDHTT